MYLRALFKVRRAIKRDGFPVAMMAYTGLSREEKARYVARWEGTNARWLKKGAA